MYELTLPIPAPLVSGVQITANSVRRAPRMRLLYEALKGVVGGVQKFRLRGISCKDQRAIYVEVPKSTCIVLLRYL